MVRIYSALIGVTMGAWGYYPNNNDSALDAYAEAITIGISTQFFIEAKSPDDMWVRLGALQEALQNGVFIPTSVVEIALDDLAFLQTEDKEVLEWKEPWSDIKMLNKCIRELSTILKRMLRKPSKFNPHMVVGWPIKKKK